MRVSPKATMLCCVCLLASTAGNGCAADELFLVVEAKTDFEPGVDFTSVRTQLARDDVAMGDTTVYASEGDTYRMGVRVAELTGLARGPLSARVSLMAGATPLVERTVVIDLQNDFAVTVVFARACVGVTCPRAADDPSWTTCGDEGICVDPRCSSVTPELCRPSPDASVLDAGPLDGGDACPIGSMCEDGDACTHDDRCDAEGVCHGTPLVCASDACTTRTCDGSATCAVTFPGNETVCDDANPCTFSVCDGAGGCVPVPINTDGSQPIPGDYLTRCCGNTVVNIIADPRHCGGCFIDCQARGCTDIGFGIGVCNCTGNAECRDGGRGPDWTCYDHPGDGRGLLCNCQSDADCSYGQHCVIVSGVNFCMY